MVFPAKAKQEIFGSTPLFKLCAKVTTTFAGAAFSTVALTIVFFTGVGNDVLFVKTSPPQIPPE